VYPAGEAEQTLTDQPARGLRSLRLSAFNCFFEHKCTTVDAMFKEALRNIVEGTDGGLAGLLMDFEGIPVETYSRKEATVDIESVGAEVSVVVKAIQRATEMLDAGETREVAFKSDKLVTLIRVINESYFVAVTLTPEGNLGKGRYLLRVIAPELADELAS
jgi:predicted regulator of Ras-like GTPase activity (Roadblock/LC7/MglB family)